jgi:organic radical activating enzyme
VRVNKIYDRVTVQGEGAHAGQRCTFVRLYGCNLHCVWCDSAETWDTKALNGIAYPYRMNSRTLTPVEVAHEVRKLDVDVCVITGGEPLLQRDELIDLAALLDLHGIAVHVETNGTFSPGPLVPYVEYFSVSPKLPNAQTGEPNLPVLEEFAALGWERCGFKTVVQSAAELGEVAKLYDQVQVERRARWVMPEGITGDRITDGLVELTEAALALGFNVTGRQHVMLWGNERGR